MGSKPLKVNLSVNVLSVKKVLATSACKKKAKNVEGIVDSFHFQRRRGLYKDDINQIESIRFNQSHAQRATQLESVLSGVEIPGHNASIMMPLRDVN